MKSIRLRSDLTGSSSRKPVAAGPGRQRPAAEHAVGEQPGGARRDLLGDPERHRQAGVDWAMILARVESLEVVAAVVEHPGHFSM